MLAPIVALLVAQYPASPKPVPTAYAPGFRSIVEADARALVAKLAGPEFMGRGPGQPGYDAAAQFAAGWFQQNGLAPAGDNGTYFQRMFLSSSTVDRDTARMRVPLGSQSYAWSKDFSFAATGDMDVSAPLAFVHFSDDRVPPETDLAKLAGHIVIVDSETPRSALGLQAIQAAQATGTLGATVIASVGTAIPRATFTHARGETPSLLALVLSKETVAGLRSQAKLDPEKWHEGIQPIDLSLNVAGKVKVTDQLETMNVLAKLEGSDRRLRKEAVVIGSHLDHLGTSDRGTYWGADDNGSGSSANLMIARAFAQNPIKPKRTVLFCLWTMEEKGLLGSQFYTAHPTMPLRDTVAYVNMDMVGRDSDNPAWTDRAKENLDAVYASSAKVGSPEMYRLVKEANRAVGLNLRDDREDRTMRSDTGSFARVGIPVLKAFTGEHPDYHRMTDTPDKLNYPKMARVAQWVYLCAQDLANRPGRPAYSATGRYVRGRVKAATDLELPTDAVIEVRLFEGKKLLDESTLVNTGHLPQIFTLRYDAAKLDLKKSYTVEARITQGGKVTMASSSPVPVLTKGGAGMVEVLVEPKPF